MANKIICRDKEKKMFLDIENCDLLYSAPSNMRPPRRPLNCIVSLNRAVPVMYPD
jgi:hypothetical protein